MKRGTLREFISHLNTFKDEVKDKPFKIKNKNGEFVSPLVAMVDENGNIEIGMSISDIDKVTLVESTH